jgi:uncharacterized protein YukE
MLNMPNSTEQQADQSQKPPKRQSSLPDTNSSAGAPQHRNDHTCPSDDGVATELRAEVPRTKHAGASSGGSSFGTMIARALGLSHGSGQGSSANPASLLRSVEDLKMHNASLQQELEDLHSKIAQLGHDNGRLQQRLHQAAQQIADSHHQYNEAMEGLKAELKQSNARAATLQRKVADDEERLSRVYTAAVSTFARDVSRDLPDDIVKGGLSTFFHGDFFSWCADMCVPQIAQHDSTLQHLRSIDIINGAKAYLEAPKCLHFDMNISDGSSPLVLLQAALAKALCGAFLTSPFFLARQREALEVFEQELARGAEVVSSFLMLYSMLTVDFCRRSDGLCGLENPDCSLP